MNDEKALQKKVTDAIRQALSDGEALQCTRDWSAWLYKTMTDEDFTDASDGPLVDEVAAAVLPIIRAEVAKARTEAWDLCAREADRRWVIGAQSAALLRDSNPYRTEQDDA